MLPFALTERSGVDPDQIQTWISIFLAVYGAALLAAAPFCGWAADRSSSRRMPLLFGLLALGGSTVMLCVGDSIGLLAAGRVLQGISAAGRNTVRSHLRPKMHPPPPSQFATSVLRLRPVDVDHERYFHPRASNALVDHQRQ